MKKITSLFVAGITLFAATQLTSCKKKDDPKTIVGKWNSQSISSKVTTNGVVTSTSSFDFPGLYTMTLNGDKTYTSTTSLDPTFSESGTYVTFGTKIVLNYTEDGVSMSDTSDYEFSENSLILIDNSTVISGTDTIVTEDKSSFTRG